MASKLEVLRRRRSGESSQAAARRRVLPPHTSSHQIHAMTTSGRYFIPGPVEIDSDVAAAMLRPMIGHRGAEARALVAGVQPGLQALFGTNRPVMMATGSATAMIEAAVRAGVRERALCIIGGTF